ncbi:Xylose isomerase domain protein TIM barrel [Methanocaldococcus infernus ME]|uniref:Xylose isomerase domain protein TIM barrel n=1 Tax=Methanocaldococcus infernus (strain DSM 11812 / JCM 15783 / ME) TaxID=573063 RepID=D5VQC7_METIM|nr:TIM barrel protein [Methanocaldococcus infernus]ADG12780.1 Xylose isomerase domain protein TIM barrel [Methanocaldococcus infernus ME]
MLIFGSACHGDEFKFSELLKSLNLNALELEFVNGVYMKEDYAKILKEKNKDLKFSAHAPHYINLNANEKEKIERSIYRLIKSAKVLRHCGKDLVFHPGYYLNKSKEECYKNIKENLQKVLDYFNERNIDITLRPETTGRVSQFGTLEETLTLCSELSLKPCIDFPHLYARSYGKINSYEDFYRILEKIEESVGVKDMHIHMSGIEFGKGGEKRHLPLERSNFNYKDALRALKDFCAEGKVICESPLLEKDALLMKRFYESL